MLDTFLSILHFSYEKLRPRNLCMKIGPVILCLGELASLGLDKKSSNPWGKKNFLTAKMFNISQF